MCDKFFVTDVRLNLFTHTALASYKAEDVRPKTKESSLLHSRALLEPNHATLEK